MTVEQDQRRQREGNVWVYGVVAANATLAELERRGDRLPEVWIVEAGDLGAIAGPAPAEDEKGTRDQALAHARVLEAAIVDAPVIPFRFGVVVPEAQDVGEDVLLAHHDEFAQLLERAQGRVQMTLKAYYDEDALLREIVEREPEIARLRDELRDVPEDEARDARVRLGELVSRAVEQARERDAAGILEQLRPVAVAAATDPLERDYMVLNAPLLVERERREEFEDAVEQLARERGERMRFRLLGPMPAYSFLEGEDPRWG
ncbi:MAG TPA: GvpL/GvpF family gas vesicle protein [Conexibacter sp.]|nr:GvpL/GvpF family gas vesicle protein [Conexibacter sp.]